MSKRIIVGILMIIPLLTIQNLLDPRLRGDDNLKIRTHLVIPAQAGIQEVIFVLVGIITGIFITSPFANYFGRS